MRLIAPTEHRERLAAGMAESGVDALWLEAVTTGARWDWRSRGSAFDPRAHGWGAARQGDARPQRDDLREGGTIIPRITGRAWVKAKAALLRDPSDLFPGDIEGVS